MFNNKNILITGGTGYFGQNFVNYVINNFNGFVVKNYNEIAKKILFLSNLTNKNKLIHNSVLKTKKFYLNRIIQSWLKLLK